MKLKKNGSVQVENTYENAYKSNVLIVKQRLFHWCNLYVSDTFIRVTRPDTVNTILNSSKTENISYEKIRILSMFENRIKNVSILPSL